MKPVSLFVVVGVVVEFSTTSGLPNVRFKANTGDNYKIFHHDNDKLVEIIEQRSLFVNNGLGNNNRNRIIGGDDALLGEFPWQVSIQIVDEFGYQAPICGGTIISTSEILTAAHCLYNEFGHLPISSLIVVAGAHDIFNPDGTEQNVRINYASEHDDFDMVTYENDIAILQLSTSLIFNSRVSSIQVAENSLEAAGECIATGWGNIRNDGDFEYPDVLQKVTLDVVDRNTCKEAYEEYNEVTSGMICASRNGKGTCLGDSGGPLVCETRFGDKYLAGIVSWGIEPCAIDPGYPSVFTHVSYYKEWIDQQFDKQ